jgi:hypothetical protein
MAAFSEANRVMNIHNFLVIVVICVVRVVVADYAEEESANTHISLGEFDLDDQCYKTAESEWAFQTRSNLPDTALRIKVSDMSVFVARGRSKRGYCNFPYKRTTEEVLKKAIGRCVGNVGAHLDHISFIQGQIFLTLHFGTM